MYLHYDDEQDDAPRDEILRPLLHEAATWTAFYLVIAALIVLSDQLPLLLHLTTVAGK